MIDHLRVATDIGGTFTDVVTLDENGLRGRKVLSTRDHPHRAVTGAISTLSGMSSFSHGTTVATNALLERRGARVAFLTTRGFRDVLYIARQKRPRLYDFDCERPRPVVPYDLCFEVPERLAPDGSVLRGLSPVEAARLADQVALAGAEAAAICLLFSYKNPAHEMLLEEALKKRDISVCRSSEIIPEFREFERASTTTINAFVQPVVRGYLERIRRSIRDAGGPSEFYMMKSGGGVAASHEVHPVEMLLSGPAGGVSGGLLLGRQVKRRSLVTFDMGGTSADFSAIVEGIPLRTDEGDIDGLPIRIPILDIITIGAGGGSIAWLDRGGALQVGPESAGSEPGPACYDLGGTRPTVTDANLLCGILDPGSFLGTAMILSPEKARTAIQSLSEAAGLSLEETMLGIRSVVNANMLRGMRRTTVEKGIDARDCTLLAFGGAGPIHAAELAAELGITEVLVPPMAGMFSALGILLSDVRLDYGETLMARWDTSARLEVESRLKRFKGQARASLARQGLGGKPAHWIASLDMRYQGQGFHLAVGYDSKIDMAERFHQTFKRRYGYVLEGGPPVEVVAVRLSAIVSRDEIPLPEAKPCATADPVRQRKILLSWGWETAPVYYRADLGASFCRGGPLIVEDEGCTVFVPPGCEISMEARGCLKISVNQIKILGSSPD